MVIDARSRLDQLMFGADSRQLPVAPTCRGRPGKNERPRTIAGFTPSAIMSPGSLPVHPDKAGRRHASESWTTHAAFREVITMSWALAGSLNKPATVLAGIKVVRPRSAAGAPP